MKNTFKIASFLVVMILFAMPVLVLAGGPGFGGGVNDGGNGCTVPLDGGSSLLIAAGIGYAAKFLHKKKEKAQELKK